MIEKLMMYSLLCYCATLPLRYCATLPATATRDLAEFVLGPWSNTMSTMTENDTTIIIMTLPNIFPTLLE